MHSLFTRSSSNWSHFVNTQYLSNKNVYLLISLLWFGLQYLFRVIYDTAVTKKNKKLSNYNRILIEACHQHGFWKRKLKVKAMSQEVVIVSSCRTAIGNDLKNISKVLFPMKINRIQITMITKTLCT